MAVKKTNTKQHRAFVRRLKEAQKNGITLIVLQEPQELGATYEQMIESLNALAEAELNLTILPRGARESDRVKPRGGSSSLS